MIVEKNVQTFSKALGRAVPRGTYWLIKTEDWPNKSRILSVERSESAAKAKQNIIRDRNPHLFRNSK